MFPVVVDELSDAGTSRGEVAATERHVVRLIAGPGAHAITNVRVRNVDELVGHPRDAEPVGVLEVATALVVRLESVEALLHVDAVPVTSH